MDRREAVYHGTDLVSEEFREVSWEQVRAERDHALKDSDWRAGKDVVLSTAWKEYRQALRDLGGFDDANSAADSWPVAPDE
jgi:hypothetical protein